MQQNPKRNLEITFSHWTKIPKLNMAAWMLFFRTLWHFSSKQWVGGWGHKCTTLSQNLFEGGGFSKSKNKKILHPKGFDGPSPFKFWLFTDSVCTFRMIVNDHLIQFMFECCTYDYLSWIVAPHIIEYFVGGVYWGESRTYQNLVMSGTSPPLSCLLLAFSFFQISCKYFRIIGVSNISKHHCIKES